MTDATAARADIFVWDHAGDRVLSSTPDGPSEPVLGQSHSEFRIAGCDVRICAPTEVVRAVDSILARVPRATGCSEMLRIDVGYERGIWRIGGTAREGMVVLGHASAVPRVAGATVAAAVAEVAQHRNLHVWRAAVVQRDGTAMVMTGDDWESCITLAVHLHTRGWRIVAGDYAIVTRDTFVALAFQKSLHANSACTPSFPLWYRRAVEASPWYVTGHVVAYYAIDATLVSEAPGWGGGVPIRAVLNVDGRCAEHPSIEAADDFRVGPDLSARDFERAGIGTGSLVLGQFIETCDLLDTWFEMPRKAIRGDRQ